MATEQHASEWLDTRTAAAEYGGSVHTWNKWRVTGGGPRYTTLGRLVRYRRQDIEDWLESRIRLSTSYPDSGSPGGAA